MDYIIPKLVMYLSKYMSTSQFDINVPFPPNLFVFSTHLTTIQTFCTSGSTKIA